MKTFDPTKPALLHEQLNDRLDQWPGVSAAEWRRGSSWHDREDSVINWNGLLYDGWMPIKPH